jgi:hypothetical protein
VGKLGGFTAFAAEAALWVTGAALIASAAGAHWSFDPSAEIGKFIGPGPTPTVSASPTVPPLAPGASPTISPIVSKYLAIAAQPAFQIRAKFNNDMTFTMSGTAYQMNQNGTLSYKGGDATDSHRETLNGAVNMYDYVYLGQAQYESKNGAAWTKSARPANDIASDKLMFAPTMAFADKGVETKNGVQLHRLEVADPAAFSKAVVQTSTSGATDAQMTYTVWVGDDGIPAAIELAGWEDGMMQGVSVRVTADEQFRIVATSGVTIAAPI